jgi:hypothetical protein
MIQLVLEYGADPLLEISTYGSRSGAYGVIVRGVEIDGVPRMSLIWDLCQEKGGRLPFLDLVQSWALNNRDTILVLISRFQNRQLKECAVPAK